jgi:hypothetical protein
MNLTINPSWQEVLIGVFSLGSWVALVTVTSLYLVRRWRRATRRQTDH